MTETYSLNLSPRYCSDWTNWSVARECLSNAIDAAGDDAKVITDGDDVLSVWTPTIPNLSELFVIGNGSKSQDGATIGQFGEGLKMAALVATRTPNSKIYMYTPGHQVSFGFVDVKGCEVLHAYIDRWPVHEEGFMIELHMPGIATAMAGKILDDRTPGPKLKGKEDVIRVFCKGILVCEEDNVRSIWDWNLNDLKINRDRSMVNRWDLMSSIRTWLSSHATPEVMDEIIRQPNTIEGKEAFEYMYSTKALDMLGEAFCRVHGDAAVIETGDKRTDLAASDHGSKVIELPEQIREKLNGRVRTAFDTLQRDWDLERVESEPYLAQIARLRKFDPIVGAPNFSVSVFANREALNMGRADREDNRLWLNEALFLDGREMDLTMTYLHEIAHLMSGEMDCTSGFQFALTQLLGSLGMAALAGTVGSDAQVLNKMDGRLLLSAPVGMDMDDIRFGQTVKVSV